MLQTVSLSYASLLLLVSLAFPVGALAQTQEELEAFEAELLEYQIELDERAEQLDQLEAELGAMEESILNDTASAKPDEVLAEAEAVEVVESTTLNAEIDSPAGEFFLAPQSTAVTTKVYDSRQLALTGISGLGDMVAGNTAGLLIQPSDFDATALDLSLRGLSGTTVHQATGDTAVGVFIDGVYVARSQGLTLDFVDLERVEVQRGPQGVLSGRNTTGGAVHFTSRKPSGEFGVEQQLIFGGEYDEVKSVTHINLPRFADLINAKVSYMIDDHKGWVSNPGQRAQENDFWSRDNKALRLAINIDNGGPFSYSYAFDDAEITSTAPYFQAVDNGERERAETARSGLVIPESHVDIQNHNQTIVLSGASASLTSIVGYREVDSKAFTNFDGLFGTDLTPTTSVGDQLKQDQFSIDVRVDTSLRDDTLDLVLGVVSQRENVEIIELGNSGTSDVESYSVYAQAILAMSERLNLTLGWRETADEKVVQSLLRDGATSGEQTRIEDDNTSYNAALSFQVNDSLRSWISISSAFKAAGASLMSDAVSPYDAEVAETIEVGVDGSAWQGKLDYSLVAYSTDLDDRQVAYQNPENIRFTEIINDPNATTIEGLELALAVRPIESLQLSAFYSYIDSEANEMLNPFNAIAGTVRFERAPEEMASLALDYDVAQFEAGDLALHVEYIATGVYYFEGLNPEQSAREIVNVRLNMSGLQLEDESGTLEVGLWIDNMLDEDYPIASQYIRADASDAIVSTYGEPRTYGMDIRYAF